MLPEPAGLTVREIRTTHLTIPASYSDDREVSGESLKPLGVLRYGARGRSSLSIDSSR